LFQLPPRSVINGEVSHNVSRAQQDEDASKRRVAQLKPFLVRGWTIDPSRAQVVEIRSVLGSDERGEQVLPRCRRGSRSICDPRFTPALATSRFCTVAKCCPATTGAIAGSRRSASIPKGCS
jgi:hypothetical protein